MKKTMTRADLYDAIYNKIGLSRAESSKLVESILDTMCAAIVAGESVKLSSFGTFDIRRKKERVGRNPKTGKTAPISSRRVLVFRPSHMLKNRVNSGGSLRQATNNSGGSLRQATNNNSGGSLRQATNINSEDNKNQKD